MTPDDYRRAGSIFEQICDLPEEARAAALDNACAGNTELRARLECLLEADRDVGGGSFLERHAIEDAAQLLAPEIAGLPAAGTVIGTYRLGPRIGAGGMGVVYEGHDLRLQRPVAIKVLPTSVAGEGLQRIQRFQRESRAASLLNHPNIVSILDANVDQGYYYIAMELVEGKNLRQLMASGSSSLESGTILDLVSQAASALNTAHRAGIVHRDIKPENIMLRPDGFVKVVDFGLAKLREPSDSPGGEGSNLRTRPGALAGTVHYLSPEQVAGRPVDARSDLFSLGVVAYELATGVRPFDGPTDGAIYEAILNRTPERPSVLRPTLLNELDGLIMRALEKDPELRFQTAADMRSSCKRLSRDASGNSAPSLAAGVQGRAADSPKMNGPAARMSSMRLALSIAGAAIVIAAIAVLLAWRAMRPVSQPLLRLSVDLPHLALLSEEVKPGSSLALSPDGARIVYTGRTNDGTLMLYTRTLNQEQVRPLAGTEGAYGPFFSPDGQSVAFFADGKLKKISVDRGGAVVLCDVSVGAGGSWGEDGNIIASLGFGSGLSRISADGGSTQPVMDVVKDKQEPDYVWPQVLPGAREILFTVAPKSGIYDEATIEALSLKTGQKKILLRGGYFGRYVPSGHLLYVHQGILYAVPMDARRLALTGPATPVVDEVLSRSTNGFADFDCARNGMLAFVRAGVTSQRLMWRESTGQTHPLRATDAEYYGPIRLSPDGKKLAIATVEEGNVNLGIYEWMTDTLTRLTFTPGFNGYPVWTPDGKTPRIQLQSERPDGSVLDAGRWRRPTDPADGKPESRGCLVVLAGRPATGFHRGQSGDECGHLDAAARRAGRRRSKARSTRALPCHAVQRDSSSYLSGRALDRVPVERVRTERDLRASVSGTRRKVAGLNRGRRQTSLVETWK